MEEYVNNCQYLIVNSYKL